MVINLGAQECSEGYCSGPVCVCVFVSVSVRSFLPPCESRPQNISTYGFTARRKKLFFAKNALIGRYAFACLECHQLHLSPKIRTPMESVQRGHDIAIRDFN